MSCNSQVHSIICRDKVEEGYKVLHVEQTPYYGGYNEGSIRLTDKDFQLALENLKGTSFKLESFQFNNKILLDLNPYVMTASGELAETLLRKDLSRYLDFRPIEKVGIIFKGLPIVLPKSKEEIMLDTDLSLIQKRQVMKVLSLKKEVAFGNSTPFGEFTNFKSLEDSKISDMIIYGICGFECSREAAFQIPISEIFHRVSLFLKSLAHFNGVTALIYPYGGVNSIIQAMCRSAAVKGAIYLLDQSSLSFDKGLEMVVANGYFDGQPWSTTIKKDVIQIDPESAPYISYVRGIILLQDDCNGLFGDNGCNFWIIPPEEGTRIFPISLLQVDSSTNCGPPGQLIVYCWSRHCTEEELKSAMSKILVLPYQKPSHSGPMATFAAFYSNQSSMGLYK